MTVNQATDWTSFGVSKLKRRLYRFVWVYTCQIVKFLEISCRGSYFTSCRITYHINSNPVDFTMFSLVLNISNTVYWCWASIDSSSFACSTISVRSGTWRPFFLEILLMTDSASLYLPLVINQRKLSGTSLQHSGKHTQYRAELVLMALQ